MRCFVLAFSDGFNLKPKLLFSCQYVVWACYLVQLAEGGAASDFLRQRGLSTTESTTIGKYFRFLVIFILFVSLCIMALKYR